ncbi:carbohydrate ABC transporter membrane protein 1 (CUT1 family) [Hydrogenispora ethanolica]|jgi:putative spermidine/putrescine transport system permease protein|uniref:Carbohydrate ABC transporter membrane protein 1 (CUT1 family) n=1 Tax=Hydrogenispora ethanolica TaxID=1082276 RepID=A0A4R1RIK6_HYDET|nr:ABC transporter permease [Hydrogenispora ethanolica]TCL65938.1 carbohydrate ABC transporter membrane protein 1 (CUT1 family) [Hydrogenispora ethanolica]
MNNTNKWDRALFLTLLPAIVFIIALFIYPFFHGFYLSLTDADGAFTLDNYLKFFTDQWEARTIGVTLGLALPATLLNVILAIPFAYFMRHGMKGEKLITFFLIVPITLGTVLVAEGMLTYMGPNGWLNQLLMALHLVKRGAPFQFTHNYLGVMISLIIQGFPFAFLMLLGYISGINPDLEKAAKILGASRWQTFRRILFPLLVPGIAIAFCLNFVMAFSVFPSAVLLGQPSGPTRVISIAAFQWAFEKFDFNMGSAVSMIMAAIELFVVMLVLFWRSRVFKSASISGGKG